GDLALPGTTPRWMAVVVRHRCRCLRYSVDLPRYTTKICTPGLSLRRMNSLAFIVIAVFTLTMGVLAAILPKLMHAALSLAAMFVGVAAFFFLLGAEFVGLVQIFVYVGAVAVLIVFTILLTRRDGEQHRGFNWNGVVIAIAVFGALLWAILMMPS